MEQLQTELSSKDAQVRSLSSEAEQLKKEIVDYEAQISELAADADWLKRELTAKDELLMTEKNVVNKSWLYYVQYCTPSKGKGKGAVSR